MIKISTTLAFILLCCNSHSQESKHLSERFNDLINYVPSNLDNTDLTSDLEKRLNKKINTVNTLFIITTSEKDLQLRESDLTTLDKHAQELAEELHNDGIYFLVKDYMSDGCVPISTEEVNGRKVDVLVWCYGDIVKNDEAISRIFRAFNKKMKELL